MLRAVTANNSEEQRKTAKRPFLVPGIAVKSQNLSFESLQTLQPTLNTPNMTHTTRGITHSMPNEAWKQANSGDIDNQ